MQIFLCFEERMVTICQNKMSISNVCMGKWGWNKCLINFLYLIYHIFCIDCLKWDDWRFPHKHDNVVHLIAIFNLKQHWRSGWAKKNISKINLTSPTKNPNSHNQINKMHQLKSNQKVAYQNASHLKFQLIFPIPKKKKIELIFKK